jgi:dihydrofolate reductase
MKLHAILALSRDGALGDTRTPSGLPWPRLGLDLQRFRRLTEGRVVLMGRRTHDTLPPRGLPGRRLVVLTRHLDATGRVGAPCAWVRSVEDALAAYPGEEVVVLAGGAEVYRALLWRCSRIYLTTVEADYPEADVRLDPGEVTWRRTCLSRERHPPEDGTPVAVTFSEWV